MKLYVWDKVLQEAFYGLAFSLANSEDEARSNLLNALKHHYKTTGFRCSEATEEQWAMNSRQEAGGLIPDSYFEDRRVIEGPPSAVHSEPVAILIEGSA